MSFQINTTRYMKTAARYRTDDWTRFAARPVTRDEALVQQHRAVLDRIYAERAALDRARVAATYSPPVKSFTISPFPDMAEVDPKERIRWLEAEVAHKRNRVASWDHAVRAAELQEGPDSLHAVETRHRARYYKLSLQGYIDKHLAEIEKLKADMKPKEPDICDLIMQEGEQ